AHPERVAAIVSQNGNAYLEGFSDAWGAWQNYWASPTPENREACRGSLSPAAIRDVQYLHGSDPRRVSPDGYTLDIAYMARPGGSVRRCGTSSAGSSLANSRRISVLRSDRRMARRSAAKHYCKTACASESEYSSKKLIISGLLHLTGN